MLMAQIGFDSVVLMAQLSLFSDNWFCNCQKLCIVRPYSVKELVSFCFEVSGDTTKDLTY
jgi:hypothetical protein